MTNDNDRKNKRILLVDDEPDVTYTLEIVLEDKGFMVDSYTDPTLALSNFKPGLYDLLLLDIKICFLTASELFYEKYRKISAYPRVDKEKFIQKPLRTEELIRRLNEILLD